MATKTKSAVDLVIDTVKAMNTADAQFGNMCRKLAAASVVFIKQNGGDKPAMNRLSVMLDGLASKSTRKHVSAWVPKGFLEYEAVAGAHEDATAARDAVLEAFGSTPWRELREQFRAKRDPKPGKGPVAEKVTDGTRKSLPEGTAVPAEEGTTVEVLPIRAVDAILASLETLDNDALALVAETANAILAGRLSKVRQEAADAAAPLAA